MKYREIKKEKQNENTMKSKGPFFFFLFAKHAETETFRQVLATTEIE